MKHFSLLLWLLLPGMCGATSVMPKSLTNLVAEADHVVIGKVTVVDMIDDEGHQVTNLSARTGPDLPNTIRLNVTVQTNGVLFTTATQVPQNLTIPLWPAWHHTLEQIKGIEEGQTRIFLLKGSSFGFAYVAGCSRELSERPEIERLLKEIKVQNNAFLETGDPGSSQFER